LSFMASFNPRPGLALFVLPAPCFAREGPIFLLNFRIELPLLLLNRFSPFPSTFPPHVNFFFPQRPLSSFSPMSSPLWPPPFFFTRPGTQTFDVLKAPPQPPFLFHDPFSPSLPSTPPPHPSLKCSHEFFFLINRPHLSPMAVLRLFWNPR